MTTLAPWEAYLDGQVERSEHTPEDILDICRDWHDDKRSAMYRFWTGEQVKPMQLQTEASKAMGGNTLGQAEDARLKRLVRWAIREEALSDALRALKSAADDFKDVQARNEIDSDLAAQLWAAATGTQA